MRPRPTQQKRLREQTRDQRKREKAERRAERQRDRASRDPADGDPDLAGIVPGPQPPLWDDPATQGSDGD